MISAFSGVGGFDLGALRAGIDVVAQIEIDKNCQKVLRKQFPDILLHDDISTATEWAKENGLTGTIDIVAGGFPCQDLSIAGKRAGLAGNRSGLFWETLRFTKEIGAHTLILENVPGLLSSNQGRDFAVLISALAESGLDHIEWRVLDSQFFGVPQRRKRIFIIATSRNRSGRPILLERESLSRNSQESQSQGQAITGSSQISTAIFTKKRRAQSIEDFETWAESAVSPTLTGFDNGDIRTTTAIVMRMRQGKEGGGKGALMSKDKSLTLATGNDQSLFIFYGNRVDDVRIQGDVINTLQARMGTGGNNMPMIAQSQVRRLTPRECERLQGFPDDWTDCVSDSSRYKQMGNAITVPVAEYFMRRVMKALSDE